MRHPTDTARLPVRGRSEEAAEVLNAIVEWLAEIDEVLREQVPAAR